MRIAHSKFVHSIRAISPIFATLILIAISVIAGIVVYMFTSGTLATMTQGGTTGQEKAAIQGASAGVGQVTVYAMYVSGGMYITINGALIRDVNGTTIRGTVPNVILPLDGALTPVTVTPENPLMPGDTYTVILTTLKGGSFVSPSFVMP